MPKETVCESPSTVAITGEVMAIFFPPFSATTGEVMAMLSFFTFPPKIYPATILNPTINASLPVPRTVVCATIRAGYSRTSYPSIFLITVYSALSTRDPKYPQPDQRTITTMRMIRIVSIVVYIIVLGLT